MAFFQRVFSYVFNEVLVNTLANRYLLLDYEALITEGKRAGSERSVSVLPLCTCKPSTGQ